MPAESEYQNTPNLMKWFLNDFDHGFRGSSIPLANIVETKENFRIELAAPGFFKNDFKIKLEGQILSISSEKPNPAGGVDENFVRQEFSQSPFTRSFRLSNWVDTGNIAAKYESGILFVTIPKVEEAKSKPSQEIVVD
jgi:HSP20 family protein